MFMKISWKYCYLIFLIYIGVFWSWIQYSLVDKFTYWDEIYALLFSFFVIKAISEGGCIAKKEDILIWISLLGYCVSAIMGNVLNGYATVSSVINDLFLNLKFFLSLYATIFILRDFNFNRYRPNIIKHAKFLTIIFGILFIFDKLFGIFPVYEIRFGINSEQLIFAHPTFCAAALFFLLMLFVLFGEKGKKTELLYMCILAGLICMTLRFKAIATVGVFIVLYVLFMYFNIRKLNLLMILLVGVGVILISYKQVFFYFFSPMALEMPRGAMLYTSLQIAKDYFPFGTGFGTFGSYTSGVNYSVVYEIYGVNEIGGMSKTDISAISDNYWPMILGQSGVIGFLCMLNIWRKLYQKIDRYRYLNLQFYLAGMGCFIYILISSTSESAIVNPVSIPLTFILGIVFAHSEVDNR